MSKAKSEEQLRRAYERGARWAVIVHYGSPALGEPGEIISVHRSYERARAAARRSGWDSFVAIDEMCRERCGA